MRLLVEGPGAASRVIPVLAGLPVRLGRDAGVEIQLDDTRASRCHAAIEFDGAGATVVPGLVDTHIHLDKVLIRDQLAEHDGTLKLA